MLASWNDNAQQLDFGIAINPGMHGIPMDPYWGDHSSLHEYTVEWIGDGSRLSAVLVDPRYDNNLGGPLRVDIYVLQ